MKGGTMRQSTEAAESTKPYGSLDAIAMKYGTDKSSSWHSYTTYYQEILELRRTSIKGLLELGVLKGSSLKTWSEWLPNARICGIDRNPHAQGDYGRNISVVIGSQTSRSCLDEALAVFGSTGPDIIIDDASHINKFSIATFEYLFPRLNAGGIYFIEDAQCASTHRMGGNLASEMENFLLFLWRSVYFNYRIISDAACADFSKIDPDAILNYYERHIERVAFNHGLVAIYKRSSQNGGLHSRVFCDGIKDDDDPIHYVQASSIATNCDALLSQLPGSPHHTDLEIGMRKEETDFLLHFLNHRKPANILEIGVATGGTSVLILSSISSGQKLISVDLNKRYYRNDELLTGFNVDKYCNKDQKSRHVPLYGMDVLEVIDQIPAEVDFLILDTVHALPGELLSFLAIYPKLSPNCLIVLHDLTLNLDNGMSPRNYTYRSLAYSTKILFNAIVSNNKYLLNNQMSNIGAVEYDVAHRTVTQSNCFAAFTYTWGDYPASLLETYKNYFDKTYGEKYGNQFGCVFEAQQKILDCAAKLIKKTAN